MIALSKPSCCLVNATPCTIRQGTLHREKQIAWVNLHKTYDLHACYESYMVSQFSCVGAAINKFMQYYRTTIPTATIHPKLHFLEDHAVDFIKKWGTGFGFLGEQGGESVHAVFNSLQRAYNNIPNGVDRLFHMVREHHLCRCPENLQEAPTPSKRKKTDGSSRFLLSFRLSAKI